MGKKKQGTKGSAAGVSSTPSFSDSQEISNSDVSVAPPTTTAAEVTAPVSPTPVPVQDPVVVPISPVPVLTESNTPQKPTTTSSLASPKRVIVATSEPAAETSLSPVRANEPKTETSTPVDNNTPNRTPPGKTTNTNSSLQCQATPTSLNGSFSAARRPTPIDTQMGTSRLVSAVLHEGGALKGHGGTTSVFVTQISYPKGLNKDMFHMVFFWSMGQLVRLIRFAFGVGHFLFKFIPILPKTYLPSSKSSTVKVNVSAVGLCRYDATGYYSGLVPSYMASTVPKWIVQGTPVGSEFSGVVLPQGESEFDGPYAAGTIVYGITPPPPFGAALSYLDLSSQYVSKAPANVTNVEKAALPVAGVTSLQAMRKVVAGQHVLVIGASGGVGHIAVQIALAKGARVTAVCSSKNLEFVQSLGVNAVCCYDTPQPIAQSLHEAACILGAYDFIFDAVSTGRYTKRTVAAYDYDAAVQPWVKGDRSRYVRLEPRKLWDTVASVLGKYMGVPRRVLLGSRTVFFLDRRSIAKDLEELRGLVEAGKVKVNVSRVVSLKEQGEDGVQSALCDLHKRHTVGKVVIEL